MKKILTLLTIVFSFSQGFAQWPVNWNQTFQYTNSHSFSNEGRKLVADASGNVYVLSDITSDKDTVNHFGVTQYYVVIRKYNFSGVFLTQKIINVKNMPVTGNSYRSSFGLEIDGQGYIYAGYSRYNTAGNYDVEVTKFSGALVPVWTYTYGGTNNESGVDMKINNGIAYCVVKSINAAGTSTSYSIIRASAIGGGGANPALYSFAANTDVVNRLAVSASSGVFVTGYKIISGVKAVMTASISATGVLGWKIYYNNNSISGDDSGSDLVVGADGKVYVTGIVYNAATGNDAFVLAYTTTGVQAGFRAFDRGSAVDAGARILKAPTTGFLYFISSNETDVTTYKFDMVNFLSTTNATYSPSPTASINSITSTGINDVKVSAAGNVYVTGSVLATSATGNLAGAYLIEFGNNISGAFVRLKEQAVDGSFTESFSGDCIFLDGSHGISVLWLRNRWKSFTTHNDEKVDISSLDAVSLRTAGGFVPTLNNAAQGLQLYPNPASGLIYFKTDKAVQKAEIIDALGKVTLTTYPLQNNIDISNLMKGVYFARFITDDGIEVKRFVVN